MIRHSTYNPFIPRILSGMLLVGLATVAWGQPFITDKSTVTFFAAAPVEDISARNEKSTGSFDAATGTVSFMVPVREFQFKRSLMQQHFNEKYMESHLFPEARFTGVLVGFLPETSGARPARAKGTLTIHGVAREVDITGTITRENDRLRLAARFQVNLKDHQVRIPQLFWRDITESVEVSLECILKPAAP